VTGAIHLGLGDVAATLALVAVAVAVAVWERTDLEGDITVAVARSFIQLTAIGYVIDAIFSSDSILWVALLLAVMVVFGAFTARGRAQRVPTRSGRC
jgi:putative ABC transport system permease protein